MRKECDFMIKLYSQPACGMCKAMHMQLEKEKIPYEEIQDVEAMRKIGIFHTPTLELEDGTRLAGPAAVKFIKEYNRK